MPRKSKVVASGRENLEKVKENSNLLSQSADDYVLPFDLKEINVSACDSLHRYMMSYSSSSWSSNFKAILEKMRTESSDKLHLIGTVFNLVGIFVPLQKELSILFKDAEELERLYSDTKISAAAAQKDYVKYAGKFNSFKLRLEELVKNSKLKQTEFLKINPREIQQCHQISQIKKEYEMILSDLIDLGVPADQERKQAYGQLKELNQATIKCLAMLEGLVNIPFGALDLQMKIIEDKITKPFQIFNTINVKRNAQMAAARERHAFMPGPDAIVQPAQVSQSRLSISPPRGK